MEKIRIPSSLERNKPRNFLLFKRVSFAFAIFGLIFGFLFGRILSGIIAQLGFITPIFFSISGFLLSEWFYGGKYPNERKEMIIGNILKRFRIKKTRMDKERDANYKVDNATGKDIDSLYDMAGNEIIGFEIFRGDDKDFERSFKSAIENILKQGRR